MNLRGHTMNSKITFLSKYRTYIMIGVLFLMTTIMQASAAFTNASHEFKMNVFTLLFFAFL